ncbi:hypothetical protein [Halopseudomonas maritima]|uniref:hypothetical protein n=1 Tax=Halopseudomonas maritima TaxID=2918528 RepID=UPI001EEA21CD|nr:hypothetical protein [Halopseudomonas maritima]UJJ30518.1 hypothetical protein HV822_12105 [Halopseudomonas maritima]
MKKSLCATALISVLSISSVSAAEWTSGWAMGTTEYTINDGNQNELLIACSDDDGKYVQAYATIDGQVYSSEKDPGFNVILDGTEYTNPFDTYCNICGQLFPSFWEHLRTAKTLQISQRGQTVSLPTTGIDVIKPLDHPENTCRASW